MNFNKIFALVGCMILATGCSSMNYKEYDYSQIGQNIKNSAAQLRSRENLRLSKSLKNSISDITKKYTTNRHITSPMDNLSKEHLRYSNNNLSNNNLTNNSLSNNNLTNNNLTNNSLNKNNLSNNNLANNSLSNNNLTNNNLNKNNLINNKLTNNIGKTQINNNLLNNQKNNLYTNNATLDNISTNRHDISLDLATPQNYNQNQTYNNMTNNPNTKLENNVYSNNIKDTRQIKTLDQNKKVIEDNNTNKDFKLKNTDFRYYKNPDGSKTVLAKY